MVFRRSAEPDDEITNSLIDHGVYRLSEVYEDEEIKKYEDLKVPYSFWSAVKYSTVLTILLWWLPIIGQMVAGFVGGRRAGKPWKGVVAAMVPLIIIFIVTLLIDNSIIPTVIMGVDWTPSALLKTLEGMVPVIAPYIDFTQLYMTSFIDTIQLSTDVRLDVYIITAAFAYIGGIMAEQSRMEMNYVARHGGNSMTVSVGQSDGRTEPEGPEERRPQKAGRPVQAKAAKARPTPKVIRFSDLQDVTNDDGYAEEYTEKGEKWYEEGEEPDEEDVARNVAGLAKRSGKNGGKDKNIKPGDWKFI
jgi:hypothetical protein